MEFNSKKNSGLKKDLKLIIEKARVIAQGETNTAMVRDLGRDIEKLAIDVLVDV